MPTERTIRRVATAAPGPDVLSLLAPSVTVASAPPEINDESKRESIKRLRQQIRRITQQSPRTVEGALAILGSQKGPGGKTTIVNGN